MRFNFYDVKKGNFVCEMGFELEHYVEREDEEKSFYITKEKVVFKNPNKIIRIEEKKEPYSKYGGIRTIQTLYLEDGTKMVLYGGERRKHFAIVPEEVVKSGYLLRSIEEVGYERNRVEDYESGIEYDYDKDIEQLLWRKL